MRILPVVLLSTLTLPALVHPNPAEATGLKIPGLKLPTTDDLVGELTKGVKLPDNLDAKAITDLGQYALEPPKKREEYVQVGEQVLKVDKRTGKVVEVMGTVDELKK